MNIVGKGLHMKKEYTNLEDIKQRIGNNIRILREYKKIPQKNLYEYLNKSQPTLSRYENCLLILCIKFATIWKFQ